LAASVGARPTPPTLAALALALYASCPTEGPPALAPRLHAAAPPGSAWAVALFDGRAERALAAVSAAGAPPALTEARAEDGSMLIFAGDGSEGGLVPPPHHHARPIPPGTVKWGWRAGAVPFVRLPAPTAVAAASLSSSMPPTPVAPPPSPAVGQQQQQQQQGVRTVGGGGAAPGTAAAAAMAAAACLRAPDTPPPPSLRVATALPVPVAARASTAPLQPPASPHAALGTSLPGCPFGLPEGARRTRRGKRAGKGVRERASADLARGSAPATPRTSFGSMPTSSLPGPGLFGGCGGGGAAAAFPWGAGGSSVGGAGASLPAAAAALRAGMVAASVGTCPGTPPPTPVGGPEAPAAAHHHPPSPAGARSIPLASSALGASVGARPFVLPSSPGPAASIPRSLPSRADADGWWRGGGGGSVSTAATTPRGASFSHPRSHHLHPAHFTAPPPAASPPSLHAGSVRFLYPQAAVVPAAAPGTSAAVAAPPPSPASAAPSLPSSGVAPSAARPPPPPPPPPPSAAVVVAAAAKKMSTPDAIDAVRAAARAAAGAAASPPANPAARTEEGFTVGVAGGAGGGAPPAPVSTATPASTPGSTPRAGAGEEQGVAPTGPAPRPPRRVASSLSLALAAAASGELPPAGEAAAAAATAAAVAAVAAAAPRPPSVALRRLRLGDRVPSCTDLVQAAGAGAGGTAGEGGAPPVAGAC